GRINLFAPDGGGISPELNGEPVRAPVEAGQVEARGPRRLLHSKQIARAFAERLRHALRLAPAGSDAPRKLALPRLGLPLLRRFLAIFLRLLGEGLILLQSLPDAGID